MLDTTDIHRIAQFAAGAVAPEDRAEIAAWIAVLPERRALADDFARILDASPAALPGSDTRSALSRFRRSVALPDRTEGAPLTRANRRLIPTSLRMLGSWMLSAVAAVLVVAAARAILDHQFGRTATRASRIYTAAIGERVSLTLTDGTQIVLAPASRLEVPYSYGTAGRAVVLDGEAHFRVVHEASHPFTVRAANTVATDIGTTFDVRAYREDPDVRVAVSDGQVSLSVAGRLHAQTLVAQDVGEVDRSGVAQVKRSVDTTAFSAWTNGDLVYRDVPASFVIADLWRWYAIDVQVPDVALLQRRVTMRFGRGESVDQVSDVLRGLLGPRVTIQAYGDPNQASKESAQSGGDSNESR